MNDNGGFQTLKGSLQTVLPSPLLLIFRR